MTGFKNMTGEQIVQHYIAIRSSQPALMQSSFEFWLDELRAFNSINKEQWLDAMDCWNGEIDEVN